MSGDIEWAVKCAKCKKKIKDDPYFIMERETGYVVLGWFQRFKGIRYLH